MKKLCLVLGCALIAAANVLAQQPMVVVVAPFKAAAGVPQSDVNAVSQIMRNRLAWSVSVVSRAQLEGAARDLAFQPGDWADTKKAAELGAALNADWIIFGEITKADRRLILFVESLNVKTLQIMAGADLLITGVAGAHEQMGPFTTDLILTLKQADPAFAAPAASPPSPPDQPPAPDAPDLPDAPPAPPAPAPDAPPPLDAPPDQPPPEDQPAEDPLAADLSAAERDQQLLEQGQQLAEQGQQLAEKDQQLAEQGQQLAEKDQQLAEQGQQLEEQGRQLATQKRQALEQGQQLEEKDQWLALQERRLTEQEQALAEQGKALQRAQQLKTKYAFLGWGIPVFLAGTGAAIWGFANLDNKAVPTASIVSAVLGTMGFTSGLILTIIGATESW